MSVISIAFDVSSISVTHDSVQAVIRIKECDCILEQISARCTPKDLFDALSYHWDGDDIFSGIEVEPDTVMKTLTKEQVIEFFGIDEVVPPIKDEEA